MRKLHGGMGFALLVLCACSTDRVATEFGALNTLVTQTEATLAPQLTGKLEAERQAAITEAAQMQDLWILNADCFAPESNPNQAVGLNCAVTKTYNGDRVPVERQASTLKRKMSVLRTYVGALELLMQSKSEEDLTAAYSAAIASFSTLAEATESEDLLKFVKKRQKDEDTVNAVVTQAVATLRFNRMRRVVRSSNQNIQTLTDEINALIIDMEDSGKYISEESKLRAANNAVLMANPNDTDAYRAALVGLETAHASFMTYYKGTTIYSVVTIAQVHDTLNTAISSNGSVEDVVAYLEALKALAEKIEG